MELISTWQRIIPSSYPLLTSLILVFTNASYQMGFIMSRQLTAKLISEVLYSNQFPSYILQNVIHQLFICHTDNLPVPYCIHHGIYKASRLFYHFQGNINLYQVVMKQIKTGIDNFAKLWCYTKQSFC